MTSPEVSEDEKRRRAITEWWSRRALRDFIARKRSEIMTVGGERNE